MKTASKSVQRLANIIAARKRVLLVGPPATAKTARIQAAAALLGWRFVYGIDGRPADLMDRLDAAGAVVPDTAAGVSRLLPLQSLRDIMNATEPTVWFWDEIGRTPVEVQGALGSIADQLKRNGSPVVIVAATNRPQDKAGSFSLSEQLRSRFEVAFALSTSDEDAKRTDVTFLAPWRDEVTGWCDFAADAGFDSTVVAWHRSTGGRTLYTWKPAADASLRCGDFRSWQTVSELLDAGLSDIETISATVGRAIATEFLAFAALAKALPTPAEVFADPTGARVPEEPSALFFIATNLVRVANAKQVPALLAYIDRMPRVYTALAARDLHRRHGDKLASIPAWNPWFLANQDLFA